MHSRPRCLPSYENETSADRGDERRVERCELPASSKLGLLARLRYARLRHQASVEDIDYRAARGLDRALFQKLTAGGCTRPDPFGENSPLSEANLLV